MSITNLSPLTPANIAIIPASVGHYQHCACVSDLVFVVGGFEEDRATRGLGERPDGISRCASCLLAPVLMGHVLAMVPPTSETALYRALR